ncbi:MAG: InlB B-repeat-containing protein, partial [Prevotellaceae bacterium]|nr:InlB B-repeat-containing protein [Prevotellaceae bacterium]
MKKVIYFIIAMCIFMILSANVQLMGQSASNVPTSGLTAPVFGQFEQHFHNNSNLVGGVSTTIWGFCQRPDHASGILNGAGVGANDYYAWDCNLQDGNDIDSEGDDYDKPIYPVADGYISRAANWNGSSYGQLLIRHVTNGIEWYSGYLHMANITSKKATDGAFVSKDEIIGYVSNVGTTPNHLHFAVYYKNSNGQLISVDRQFNEKQTVSGTTINIIGSISAVSYPISSGANTLVYGEQKNISFTLKNISSSTVTRSFKLYLNNTVIWNAENLTLSSNETKTFNRTVDSRLGTIVTSSPGTYTLVLKGGTGSLSDITMSSSTVACQTSGCNPVEIEIVSDGEHGTDDYFQITTSSNPSAGGTTSGSGNYTAGSYRTVTATANSGYTFNNWTENGVQKSSNASYSFTLTANRILVANFISTGSGGNGCTNGDIYPEAIFTPSCTGSNEIIESNCYAGEYSKVSVTNGTSYTFSSSVSSDFITIANSTGTTVLTTGTGSVTWTATSSTTIRFYTHTNSSCGTSNTNRSRMVRCNNSSTQYFTVFTESSPTNGGNVSGGGTYANGANCTLTATPNNGYTFQRWKLGNTTVSTENPFTVTVDMSATFTAVFIQSSSGTCITCPASDYTLPTPTNLWQTDIWSISAGGCKLYKVALTQGQIYTFKTGCSDGATAEFDTQLFLYNSSCNEVADDDDGCENNRSKIENWTCQSSGNYYLKVQGFQNRTTSGYYGSYTLAYKDEVPTCVEIPNYNYQIAPTNSWNISDGEIVSGGCKIYRFLASQGTKYTFKTGCGNGASTGFDTKLYLYDSSGNELTYNDDGCEYSGGDIIENYEINYSGYAYLKVKGLNQYQYGNYTLAYNTLQLTYTIGTSSSPSTGGSTSGGGNYTNGQTCTVTATANSGYTFTNWTENGSVVSTNASYQFAISGSKTLVANFTVNCYILTFDAQGGNVTPSSKSVTYGSTVGTLPTPTRTGYTFDGWYTNTNGSGMQYTYSTVYNTAENTTIYAKWTQNASATYIITLNTDGGTGGTSSVTATYGVAMPSATAPTKTGCTFRGYYTEQNGAGIQFYTESMTSARNWDIASNTTLYAKWDCTTMPEYYTVTAMALPEDCGTISPSANVNVSVGSPKTFVFSPTNKIQVVLVDEIPNAQAKADGYYTFPNTTTGNHTITVYFDCGSGIDDLQAHNISIFPNPAETFVTITGAMGKEMVV